jgi:uncharacterized protein YggE
VALVALVAVLVLAALAVGTVLAFRSGDGSEAGDEPIRVTPGTSGISVISSESRATAGPVARLPGITVLGVSEVEVKPDVAVVRLAVGSGSGFSDGDSVQLVDEKELDPVVDALVAAGVDEDEVYVNSFSGGSYGPGDSAALITFEWSRPTEVKSALSVAQDAVRKKTDLNLESVSVSFVRESCDGPDAEGTEAALADARERAEKVATLSGVKLGDLIAVSEAPAGGYLAYAPQRCGVGNLTSGLLNYLGSAETAEEITLTTALEVTFALER